MRSFPHREIRAVGKPAVGGTTSQLLFIRGGLNGGGGAYQLEGGLRRGEMGAGGRRVDMWAGDDGAREGRDAWRAPPALALCKLVAIRWSSCVPADRPHRSTRIATPHGAEGMGWL